MTDDGTDITMTDKTADSVMKNYQKMLAECAGLLSKSITHRRQLEVQQKQTEDSVSDSNDTIARLEKELEAARSLKNEKAGQLFASLGEQEPGLAGTQPDPARMPVEELCGLFERVVSRLEQQQDTLLEELEQNREKLVRKQTLEQKLPKTEEEIKALAQDIQKAEVSLARQETACGNLANEIDNLREQLGAETKETVEQCIQTLSDRKKGAGNGVPESKGTVRGIQDPQGGIWKRQSIP